MLAKSLMCSSVGSPDTSLPCSAGGRQQSQVLFVQMTWQSGRPLGALQVAGSLTKSLLKTMYYYVVAALYGAAGGFSQVGVAGLHCIRR